MLDLDQAQDKAAETQALKENGITEPRGYHGTTIEYLKDWVIFRGVKEELKLESYPQVNVILWDAYEESGEKERPRSQTGREERTLYEPVKKRLEELSAGKQNYWAKITASQNRRGEWSRPDITTLEVDWFDLIPGVYVQVTSYEIKKKDAYGLSSVYEASAHQRMAHRTFLALEIGDQQEVIDNPVVAEAERLGVGIVKLYRKEPSGSVELETVLEPGLKNPAPRDLDEFIDDFFEEDKVGLRNYKHVIGK